MSTSGVFQLTDTNDFIHPAKGCVKVQKSSQKKREAREVSVQRKRTRDTSN
jgi:hypothetical protein